MHDLPVTTRVLWWVWCLIPLELAKHSVCFWLRLGAWMSKTSWPQSGAAVIEDPPHLINNSIRWEVVKSKTGFKTSGFDWKRVVFFAPLRIVRVWVTRAGVNSNSKVLLWRGTSPDWPARIHFWGVQTIFIYTYLMYIHILQHRAHTHCVVSEHSKEHRGYRNLTNQLRCVFLYVSECFSPFQFGVLTQYCSNHLKSKCAMVT